jgi:hypothetical protein
MLTPLDYNLPHPAFRPHQLESIQWLADCAPFVPKITEQPTGCHAKGQGILMYDGSIKMVEDVVVGDRLRSIYGGYNTVVELHRGYDQMLEIYVYDLNYAITVNCSHVLSLVDKQGTWRDSTTVAWKYLYPYWEYGLFNGLNLQQYRILITVLPTIDNYYGFTLDNSPYYMLDNGLVMHNSGKSSIAMSAANNGQVIVVTKSKNLQTQYGDLYSDCAVLFGRANYPCVHRAALPNETANDCRFRENMHKCPVAEACPYLIAKENAKASQRVALNYAYWLTTYKKWNPHYLVLDEAHNLSDIVLDWVGCTVTGTDCERWHLPELPVIATGSHNPLFPTEDQTPVAVTWLSAAITILGKRLTQIEAKLMTEANLRDKHACENLSRKLTTTRDALATQPGEHWYLRSGPDVTWQGKGFICKPLTARYDASRFFFDKRERVLAMSATIGNPTAFTQELGITKYDWRVVPNQWPPETREVEILPCPSMGHSATERNPANWDLQAKIMAKKIKELPHTWAGLILVTRRKEAQLLGERLVKLGLQDRIWIMPGADGTYVPTNQQIEFWQQRMRYKSNSICISFSLWQGYDGKELQFVLIAKTPFSVISEDFERARMIYDPKFFLQRCAYILEQGAGRCRRGESSDYNDKNNSVFNSYVAIADGSWSRVQKYFSESLRESIVKQVA